MRSVFETIRGGCDTLLPPGAEERVERQDDLTEALTRRKRVRFGYHGIGRDARRTFRVDRMEGVVVNAHSVWAERNGLGTLESTDDDGARVRRFRVVQADPFPRWILGNVLQYGLDAEVLEPEGVRERVQRLVR